MKDVHFGKIEQLALAAMKDAENLREDGSVNWDFVSSDIHIDLEVSAGPLSRKIDRVINNLADRIEGAA